MRPDAEILSEIVAAFSTVIVQTTKATARNSDGHVSRHLIALDLQKEADSLPNTLKFAKDILGNIASGLDDKPIKPFDLTQLKK